MLTRIHLPLAAALLGGFLLFGAPLAAAPQQQIAGIELSADEAAQRGPNGLSYAEEIKRALIYTAGSQLVNQTTVSALLQAEVERRKAAGMPVEHLGITEEAIDARIAKLRTDFEAQNPGVDFWNTVEAMGNTRETYREEIGRMILVDQLFFPRDPELWPMELLDEIFGPMEKAEAEEAAADGQEADPAAMTPKTIMEQSVLPTYEEAKKAFEAGEDFQVGGFIAQYVLRPGVMKWLMDQAEVKQPFDGLPEGVALSVNGRNFSSDEMAAQVAPLVGPVERERARMLVDTLWTVEKALRDRETLLTLEQCKARIAEDRKEYEMSPISYEQMQLQFLGFPSMEVFHRIYRLRQSFKDSMGEVPAAELQAHAKLRHNFLGQGKVDAEVIYFAARDMTNGTYPKQGDPFAAAKAKADKAAAELQAGADWATVLLKYCDFPEAYPGTQQGMPTPNRGRFGALPRNQVRDFLGENDYFDFLYGLSIADLVFFDAEAGTIYGPVMGPTGWAIYKVNGRVEPETEIDLETNDRHQYLANDDLLNVRFFAFVDEVMASGQGE